MNTLSSENGLRVDAASFCYGLHEVLRSVTLSVVPGERVAVAGPNGSGKTTLLRLLSGVVQPSAGIVTLDGFGLGSLRSRDIARRIATVAQHVEPTLGFSVRELVAMGRTPYARMLSGESAEDRAAIGRALRETDIGHLAARRFNELSGGEQQRVMIAAGLAQETDYLLLDEPTVHLDLQHQHELLHLLLQLNRIRGTAVVAVLHDLNLAALYFERLVILSGGQLVADGTPGEVIVPQVLDRVFRAPVRVIAHPASGRPQVLLDPPAAER